MQRPQVWTAALPITFIAARWDRSLSVTIDAGRPYRFIARFRNRSAALRSGRLVAKKLEHLAFMINRTPQVVGFTIDPYEYLVQVPVPVRKRLMMNPTPSDRGRTEPVPPKPNRLVTDVNATFG